MKRFLISSPSFTGDAEIFFDSDGRFIKLDVMHTNLTGELLEKFKAKVPVNVLQLEEAFNKNITIVAADIVITSEDFMREYPYKRNTHLVHAYWPKMPASDQVKAYYAAIDYRKYCEKNKGWYNPKIPAAWLKDKEYLNDWKKM